MKISCQFKKISICALAFLGMACLAFGVYAGLPLIKEIKAYTFSSPTEITMQGVCNNAKKSLDFIPGYSSVPLFGATGQKFIGAIMKRYFIPEICAYKVKDNKELFKFNSDGSFEADHNFIVHGDRTYLLGSADFGAFKLEAGKANVSLTQKALMPGMIQPYGPSVYFNHKSSRLELAPNFSIGPRGGNAVWKLKYTGKEPTTESAEGPIYNCQPYYTDYNDFRVFKDLKDPRAMAVGKRELANSLFIADTGNRRLVELDKETGELIKVLGGSDWDWELSGVAVDNSGNLYVSDSANNRIIRTKMNGEGWLDSGEDRNRHNLRLFITGEEKLSAQNIEGVSAENIVFQDSGFTGHTVLAFARNKFRIDPATGRPQAEAVQDEEERLFGKSSLKFDGQTRLEAPSHPGFDFEKENFSIDFYFKPRALDKVQPLISKDQSFYLGLKPGGSWLVKIYQRNSEGVCEEKQVTIPWTDSTAGGWRHVALLKSGSEPSGTVANLYIDGKKIGSLPLLDAPLCSSGASLVIGSHKGESGYQDYFAGNMENLRLYKNTLLWERDFQPPYYFNNPTKILYAFNPRQGGEFHSGSFLYVVDSGNNRIVRLRLEADNVYTEWLSFGGFGDQSFQFDNPTAIAYREEEGRGYFYVVDQGNGRVVKTDFQDMAADFKNNDYLNSSWKQIESMEGGVMPEVEMEELKEKYFIKEYPAGEYSANYVREFEVGGLLRGFFYSGRRVAINFAVKDEKTEEVTFEGPFAKVELLDENGEIVCVDTEVTGGITCELPDRIKVTDKWKIKLTGGRPVNYMNVSTGFDSARYQAIAVLPEGEPIVTEITYAGIFNLPGVSGTKNPSSFFVDGRQPCGGNYIYQMYFPFDVAVDGQDVFILEGVSDKDIDFMAYSKGGEGSALDLYGTEQYNNLNMRIYGGLQTNAAEVYYIQHVKGNIVEHKYNDGRITDKWWDPEQDLRTFGDVFWKSTSTDMLGVSYCKNKTEGFEGLINQNEDRRFDLFNPEDVSDKDRCYINGKGENTGVCARECESWSLAHSTKKALINFGSYEEAEEGVKFTGTFNVTCSSTPEMVPPSECKGQWSWEHDWPKCTYYLPKFDVTGYCSKFEEPNALGKTCDDSANCGKEVWVDPVYENGELVEPGYYSPSNTYCAFSCCQEYKIICSSYCESKEYDCVVGQAVSWSYDMNE